MARSQLILILLSTLTLKNAVGLPELSITNVREDTFGAVGRSNVSPPQNDISSEPTWGSLEFYTTITVGTPSQERTVIIGTASSDLYFDASSADECQLNNANSPTACRGGSFDPSQSKTYSIARAAPAFNITYGDGSTATGPYATDVVGIGNVAISGIEFGLAENFSVTSGNSVGILGLGYYTDEAVNSTSNLYPGLVDVMAYTGVIKSRLYSIYLGNGDYSTGSVLFGGIDTTKFAGSLTTLNMLPTRYSNGVIDLTLTHPVVSITAATVTYGGTPFNVFEGGIDGAGAYNDSNSLPVAFDVGSSSWGLPSQYFDSLINAFPYVNTTTGLCNCTDIPSDETMTLTFGGEVEVSYNATQFIVPYIDRDTGKQILGTDGSGICQFLILNDTDSTSTPVFGNAFLRSMYVVYDLDNAQISVAEAVPNVTETSKVIEIPAGPNQIASVIPKVAVAASNTLPAPSPSAQLFTADYSLSTITESSVPTSMSGSGGSAVTPKASSSDLPAMPGHASSLSKGAQAGIGVGVALGSCGLIALLWFLWRRRRHQSGANHTNEKVMIDHSYDSTLVGSPPGHNRPMSEIGGMPISLIHLASKPPETNTSPMAELDGDKSA